MINIHQVNKMFKGQQVLKNVSVHWEKELIHGLVGQNGSGKTVLLKCICGFMPVDQGCITVNGKVVGKEIEIPSSLGIIIEQPGFINSINGLKNLQLLAGIKKIVSKKDVFSYMESVGLDPFSKKPVSKYSMGMRQRLALAQAIMEKPDLLLLDEPFNGLDKKGTFEIKKLLKNLQQEGTTIVLVSHNPYDIEELCDTVSEIDGGILSKVS